MRSTSLVFLRSLVVPAVCAQHPRATSLHALLAGLIAPLFVAGCGGASTVSVRTAADVTTPSAACVEASPGAASLREEVPTGPLGRDVVPTRVALGLTVDPREARFSGDTAITLDVRAPRRVIWLHGKGLEVARVTITSAAGAQTGTYEQVHETGVARVTFPCDVPAGEATLALAWTAPFLEGGDGLFKVTQGDDAYVFSQFEPISARTAFPGFDEPAFKVPYEVRLTVPRGDVAAGNARVASESDAGQGRRTLVFEPTPPLPAYLVAFAVGPLDVVEGAPIPASAVRPEPLPFRALAMRGRGARLGYAMSRVPAIVAALESYFGVAYPYTKLDFVAIEDFPGAMENAGLITFHERLLLVEGASAPESQRRDSENTIAHELAHQWFGNLVTMGWWDDLWLNEAFATWMAARIVGEVAPALGADEARLDEWREAMHVDSRASARRIRQPIASHHDIHAAFDGITYSKGGAVIGMFERWLGADTFREGVRAHLAAHRFGTATADELLGAISQVAQRDVRTPFATFLDQVGAPSVAMTLRCEAGSASLALTQRRATRLGGAVSDTRWQVPVCVRYGRGTAAGEACTLLEGETGTLALPPVGGGCPEWVAPNAGGVGYYQSSLDAATLAGTRARGLARMTMRERAAVADGLLAAGAAGALGPEAALAALTPFASDTSRLVAMTPMSLLEFFWQTAPDAAGRTRVGGIVRRLYGARGRSLGWSERAGEDGETRLLRAEVLGALARLGRDPQVRADAARRGRAYLGVGGDGALHAEAVPADLADLAVAIAVDDGDDAVFEAAQRQLFASRDPEVRARLLAALGTAEQPARAARAREVVLDERLAATEVRVVLREQMSSPVLRADAWAWLETRFDDFAARVPEWTLGRLAGYGGRFCDASGRGRVEALFGPRIERLPGGPRTLATALEEIALCTARREAQAAEAVRLR
jgi:alanyl aminopeptidase